MTMTMTMTRTMTRTNKTRAPLRFMASALPRTTCAHVASRDVTSLLHRRVVSPASAVSSTAHMSVSSTAHMPVVLRPLVAGLRPSSHHADSIQHTATNTSPPVSIARTRNKLYHTTSHRSAHQQSLASVVVLLHRCMCLCRCGDVSMSVSMHACVHVSMCPCTHTHVQISSRMINRRWWTMMQRICSDSYMHDIY